MYKYGKKSKERLATCCPELQAIFNEVIKTTDCSILCGRRDEADQTKAFNEGRSKVKWPDSKHNAIPPALSKAIDVAPYPIDWNDTARFYYFAGRVIGIAQAMGYKVRFGGDWDGDMDLKDQNFNDLPHFEYVGRL